MLRHPIDPMIEAQSIFIQDGYWYSCYEPSDMPGITLRTRYKLTPVDGGSMLKDGRHKGIIIGDGSFLDKGRTLRVIANGELCGSLVINPHLRDFKFQFDDQYHDNYKAGATRGFKGKRACSFDFYYRQCDDWRLGYEEGRRARPEVIEKANLPL